MKILYILPEEYRGPRWGGVSTYTFNIAAALAKKHQVHLVCPGQAPKTEIIQRIKIHKIGHEPQNIFFNNFCKILNLFLPEISARLRWSDNMLQFTKDLGPFDIVESPEWDSGTLFISLFSKTKVVVQLHRSWYLYRKDNRLSISFQDLLINFLEILSILTADSLVSPSRFMYTRYPISVKLHHLLNHPVVLIPYGINLPHLVSQKHQSRPPYILFVGRLEPGKGVELLITAFLKFSVVHPEYQLYLIGEDTNIGLDGSPSTSHKKELVNKFGLHTGFSMVRFLGRISRSRLSGYYNRCKFFVLPSFGHENSSLSLLEALVHGTAIISSDTGGNSEIIFHGQNGLLFKTGDVSDLLRQMNQLVNSSSLIADFKLKARQTGVKYDIKKNSLLAEKNYQNILSSTKKLPVIKFKTG